MFHMARMEYTRVLYIRRAYIGADGLCASSFAMQLAGINLAPSTKHPPPDPLVRAGASRAWSRSDYLAVLPDHSHGRHVRALVAAPNSRSIQVISNKNINQDAKLRFFQIKHFVSCGTKPSSSYFSYVFGLWCNLGWTNSLNWRWASATASLTSTELSTMPSMLFTSKKVGCTLIFNYIHYRTNELSKLSNWINRL